MFNVFQHSAEKILLIKNMVWPVRLSRGTMEKFICDLLARHIAVNVFSNFVQWSSITGAFFFIQWMNRIIGINFFDICHIMLIFRKFLFIKFFKTKQPNFLKMKLYVNVTSEFKCFLYFSRLSVYNVRFRNLNPFLLLEIWKILNGYKFLTILAKLLICGNSVS